VLGRRHRSRLRGTPYRLRTPISESVGRSLFLYGVYEPVASLLFSSILRDGDVAVDVGAHYGDFSLLAAHQVGVTGVVYAFEPQSAVRNLLVDNLEANAIGNVKVFDCALADHDGKANLYHHVETTYTGGASLLGAHAGQVEEYESVPIRRLDDVIEDDHAGRLTTIKIDVEGAEADVLRGARSILARARPAVIFEVNGLTSAPAGADCDAFRVLADAGYALYGMAPVDDGRASPRLVPLGPGADPTPFQEPWLALNLLALHPDSPALRRVAPFIE
jgi:FkbM family methyltransferase